MLVARRRLVPALLLALASACRIITGPSPDAMRYYTLALAVPPRGHAGDGFALGLGPITFPSYLDQLQLVTRLDDERIAYAPGDRWAGSLRDQFERALALRLMSALGTDDVAVFPWWPGRRIDVEVQLSVLAFEPDASGSARLDAYWTLRRPRAEMRDTGSVSLREPIGPGGNRAAVAALDRALDQLAGAIADGVRRAAR